jgi:hypothetical protein
MALDNNRHSGKLVLVRPEKTKIRASDTRFA